MKRALLALGSLALVTALHAQAPATTASHTKEYVTTLASDQFEGRLSGTAGEQRASDYIVSQLQRIGAKPLPGRSGFKEGFEFTAGTRDGGSWVSLGGTTARFDQQGRQTSGTFGSFTAARNPRRVQLALRLVF